MSFNNFISPKTFAVSVESESSFGGANLVDLSELISETAVATFSMLSNFGTSPVVVQFNGDAGARFVLEGQTTISFQYNDIHVTSYDFEFQSSGGYGYAEIEIICGVQTP